MTKYIRAAFLLAGILLFGGLSASAAQASRGILLSNAGPITANGRLTMNDDTICDVSLTMVALNNPLLKTPGVTQARVTAGSISNCRSSLGVTDGVVLTPIDIQYVGFTGTLPNITGIQIHAPNAGFQLNGPLGIACLYGGDMTGITFEVSSGTVTTVRFSSNRLPLVRGIFLCPSTGRVVGPLTPTTSVNVTLVD